MQNHSGGDSVTFGKGPSSITCQPQPPPPSCELVPDDSLETINSVLNKSNNNFVFSWVLFKLLKEFVSRKFCYTQFLIKNKNK